MVRGHEREHAASPREQHREDLVRRLLTGVHVDLAEAGQLGYGAILLAGEYHAAG